MLRRLTVKNAAIIESADIELCGGLNILSGETGAGKSVMLDALNFVLGGKADRTLVRRGAESMQAEAVFETDSGAVLSHLQELGFEPESTLIISRTLTAEGKGDIRLNGRTVTASMLRGVTARLIDVYGQSEHVSLLRPSTHIQLLDSYCGDELDAEKQALAAEIGSARALIAELDDLGGSDAERARLLDLYSFQIEEITSANLRAGEEETLQGERELMKNGAKISQALDEACAALSGEYGASQSAAAAAYALRRTEGLSDELSALSERLQSVKYEIDDIFDAASRFAAELEFDERRADKIEDRLEQLRRLRKKYGATVEDVIAYGERVSTDYERIQRADELIGQLQKKLDAALDAVHARYNVISRIRRAGAKRLEQEIMRELGQLNMKGAALSVSFEPTVTRQQLESRLSLQGGDSVEFLLSANSGEPLKSLAKVISGGEMSRFMLAIKCITAKLDGLETLVFDEIDAGISGVTASVVAQKIASISVAAQVVCVTHSPAICAMADECFLIEKRETGGRTVSTVRGIDKSRHVEEIARLAGIGSGGKSAVAHAEELLAWAQSEKAKIHSAG